MEFNHVSVLLEEGIENLDIKPDGVYVDGTLGGAGHASRVCEKLGPEGMFIGLDQDETVLKDLHVEKVDGILLDLGVSSYQLDTAERGFSYMEDAPLDMRMDRQQSISAMEIVNEYPQEELYRIIKEYGEERYARNIAKNICLAREEKKIETTFELVDIIRRSMPAKARNGKGHPAKRTFQAIRIECNHELDVLRQALDEMIDLLSDSGRLCIITFHSLEDRMVKLKFRQAENPCTCPPDFPVCVCGNVSKGKVITRKPILPSQEELDANSHSKSAKLRVFERRKTGGI